MLKTFVKLEAFQNLVNLMKIIILFGIILVMEKLRQLGIMLLKNYTKIKIQEKTVDHILILQCM